MGFSDEAEVGRTSAEVVLLSSKGVAKNCFRVMIKPGEVFEQVRAGVPLRLSLPLLFFLRQLHIYSHVWLVHREFYLEEYRRFSDFLVDRFSVNGGFEVIWMWFFGCMMIYLLGVFLGKRVSYERIEHGFFYIFIASFFLLALDVLHLFLPPTYFHGYCMHAALAAQLFLIPIWVSFMVERFLGVRKRYTVLPASFFPISIKYFWGEVFSLPIVVAGLCALMFFFLLKRMNSRTVFLFSSIICVAAFLAVPELRGFID